MRELVEKFIDHPQALQIEAEIDYIHDILHVRMQCDADDHPKLVGKGGAHFDALAILFAEIGMAEGREVRLRRHREPEQGYQRPHIPRKIPLSYNAREPQKLLVKLLTALGIGDARVEATIQPGSPIGIVFQIHTRSSDEYRSLTVPDEDANTTMTTIGALGTLFRAYAAKDGVRFMLEVKKS